jgi:two-component system, response regulator YesN
VKLRLEKSIEYLEDSKMAVKQISMKIGFNNPTYFVTWFKKNTGYSPSEYRNRFFPANY